MRKISVDCEKLRDGDGPLQKYYVRENWNGKRVTHATIWVEESDFGCFVLKSTEHFKTSDYRNRAFGATTKEYVNDRLCAEAFRIAREIPLASVLEEA